MRYAALALLVAGTVAAADERPLTPELRKASLAAWKSAYREQLERIDAELLELQALKLNPETELQSKAKIEAAEFNRKRLVANPFSVAPFVTSKKEPLFGTLPHHTGIVVSTDTKETVVKIGWKDNGEPIVRSFAFRPPLKNAMVGKPATSRGLHWVVLRTESLIVVTPFDEDAK